MAVAVVIHLGWSQCLGPPIAIIIPIRTKPPPPPPTFPHRPGLTAAKGTDYHERKNNLEGRVLRPFESERIREAAFLSSTPDIYLSEGPGRRGDVAPDRSAGAGITADPMRASRGDNNAHRGRARCRQCERGSATKMCEDEWNHWRTRPFLILLLNLVCSQG